MNFDLLNRRLIKHRNTSFNGVSNKENQGDDFPLVYAKRKEVNGKMRKKVCLDPSGTPADFQPGIQLFQGNLEKTDKQTQYPGGAIRIVFPVHTLITRNSQ